MGQTTVLTSTIIEKNEKPSVHFYNKHKNFFH
jgi:hypothetical protein